MGALHQKTGKEAQMCHLTQAAQDHIERMEESPLRCVHCDETDNVMYYMEKPRCPRCWEEIEADLNDLYNETTN